MFYVDRDIGVPGTDEAACLDEAADAAQRSSPPLS